MKRNKFIVFVLVVLAVFSVPFSVFADPNISMPDVVSYSVGNGYLTLYSSSNSGSVGATSSLYVDSVSLVIDGVSYSSNLVLLGYDYDSDGYYQNSVAHVQFSNLPVAWDISDCVGKSFSIQASGHFNATAKYHYKGNVNFNINVSGVFGSDGSIVNFVPHIDFGAVSVDCEGHSITVSLASNFDLNSVDSVLLGSSPVQYSFNPNTGILYIPNVVFDSFSYPSSVPLEIIASGINPDDGSSVSASASTNIDVSSCSTATANKTYRIGIDVKCGTDSGGSYYNIQVTFFVDGSRVSDYTASYTSTPNGGADSGVVASQFGDTYNISGRPVDNIDNYVITIHYDGKDFQAELKNPQCGDSFNYDYDNSGNLIKKSINSLLSILKDILEQIKSFIKTIFDFFKLIYALFNLSLSVLSAFVKNSIPFLIDVVNISIAFLNALTNPVSNGSLNLPTTATFFGVSLNDFASSIHSSILLIESYVPEWLWWIFAGWSFLSFVYAGLGTVRVVDKETGEVK